MKEAYLYKKLKNKKVKCLNCAHKCLITPGNRGICGVRENKKGKLYSLNYKKAIALNLDPVEKKPLYHFLPGTQTLSLGVEGCQFKCASCQNWRISQGPKQRKKIKGKEISPEEIVNKAKEEDVPSISYTYTDPTVFSEYALDTMKLAKEEKIKNIWVTSGYFSEKLFKKISPLVDAFNVDLKGFTEEFYQKYVGGKLEPVLKNLKRIKEKRIHLEVTTLVIPTLNDSLKQIRKEAEFIKQNLGENTPWHLSRFSSPISYKLKELDDTPLETLKKAYDIGKEVGLNYVYIGNIVSDKLTNTFCPSCNEELIKRWQFEVKKKYEDKKCPNCGREIDIIE